MASFGDSLWEDKEIPWCGLALLALFSQWFKAMMWSCLLVGWSQQDTGSCALVLAVPCQLGWLTLSLTGMSRPISMSVLVTLRDLLSTELAWHLTLGYTQDTPGVLTLGAQVETAKFLWPCLETSLTVLLPPRSCSSESKPQNQPRSWSQDQTGCEHRQESA